MAKEYEVKANQKSSLIIACLLERFRYGRNENEELWNVASQRCKEAQLDEYEGTSEASRASIGETDEVETDLEIEKEICDAQKRADCVLVHPASDIEGEGEVGIEEEEEECESEFKDAVEDFGLESVNENDASMANKMKKLKLLKGKKQRKQGGQTLRQPREIVARHLIPSSRARDFAENKNEEMEMEAYEAFKRDDRQGGSTFDTLERTSEMVTPQKQSSKAVDETEGMQSHSSSKHSMIDSLV